MASLCESGALTGRLSLAGTTARNTYTWLLQYGQEESDFFMVVEGSESECSQREDEEIHNLSKPVPKLPSQTFTKFCFSEQSHSSPTFKGEEIPPSRYKNYQTLLFIFNLP